MEFDTFKVLNSIYEPLHKRVTAILNELKKLDYDVIWGYYGFHSVKIKDEFTTEFFPIPVITVKDICDIGIDLDSIFIEGKLERDAALKFDFSLLQDYNFEVYGVNDYLKDFYNKNLDIVNIPERIRESTEKEIGIQICFEPDTSPSKIIEVVKKYSEWNTYILL